MAPAHPAGCSCGDEDSHTKLEGQLTFLYPFVDRDKVVALNAEEGNEAKIVIRPWDERNQEGTTKVSSFEASLESFAYSTLFTYVRTIDEWLESDADEQLILRIPFTGSVKREFAYPLLFLLLCFSYFAQTCFLQCGQSLSNPDLQGSRPISSRWCVIVSSVLNLLKELTTDYLFVRNFSLRTDN
jgi:hypothetical protein